TPRPVAASTLPPADLPEAVEGQRRVNEALRQRAAELEAAQKQLKEKACDADSSRAARQALGPLGAPDATPGQPPSGEPSQSGHPVQRGQSGQSGQPGQSSLPPPPGAASASPELSSATVLVLGEPKSGPGLGVGTGFFIDNTTVLTNGHVVDDL